MSLKLFNTRTRKLEEFQPIHDKSVGFYGCGPTVYAAPQIGNLRTYVFEDVLRRSLEFLGYSVKHVMNITDVGHLTSNEDSGEDRMEIGSKREGLTARQIADKYEAMFKKDLEALNIESPTRWMRATDFIPQQITLIERLEKGEFTYKTSDGIYFDTAKFPHYGELEPNRLAGQKAGARVEENIEKRNPTDFALWKFSPKDSKRQMEWKSPWGTGFPGWHIECSAMSMEALGEQFDLHAGGVDHIPVHHTNEIAQAEAATGKRPFVKYWIHGEFLELPEKRMGKSEGNAITVADVMAKGFDPLAFRYLVLTAHYRTKLQFSWEALAGAQQALERLRNHVQSWGEAKIGCAEFEERFRDAVANDLDTPKALAVVWDLVKSNYPGEARKRSLLTMDRVLGLNLDTAPVPLEVPQNVMRLVEQREEARMKKDFAASDELREKISAAGFTVEDRPDGPRVRPNRPSA
jgi:cysteinyl-tRNA synthetase